MKPSIRVNVIYWPRLVASTDLILYSSEGKSLVAAQKLSCPPLKWYLGVASSFWQSNRIRVFSHLRSCLLHRQPFYVIVQSIPVKKLTRGREAFD